MHSLERRKRAVEPCIRHGLRATAGIREPGYPSRAQLAGWHREWQASMDRVGTLASTTLPTASMRARNTASRLSAFTPSPEGLGILDTAPATHSTPATASSLCRSKPVGPDS